MGRWWSQKQTTNELQASVWEDIGHAKYFWLQLNQEFSKLKAIFDGEFVLSAFNSLALKYLDIAKRYTPVFLIGQDKKVLLNWFRLQVTWILAIWGVINLIHRVKLRCF